MSVADDDYFDDIINANTQNRGIAMLDARPKVNAVANRIEVEDMRTSIATTLVWPPSFS